MATASQAGGKQWTVKQAMVVAVICLSAGLLGGWAIGGWHAASSESASTKTAVVSPAVANPAASAIADAARMKDAADGQAAPLLEKLKADPKNAGLLASVGNLYYDAQQYPTAVDYYGRALKLAPSDVSVRTDLGTAYWYMHDADSAISEFKQALSYAPTNANTLFNLGLVEWEGKRDSARAIEAWQMLLASNPNYEAKDKVQKMMAEAQTAGGAAR